VLEIGDVVIAQVSQVEDYGVEFTVDQQRVLVLLPDLSWKTPARPKEDFRIGELMPIKVLALVDRERCQWRGSVREAQPPETNPYYKYLGLPSWTKSLQATVVVVLPDKIIARLDDGCIVNLRSEDSVASKGDSVQCEIEAADPQSPDLFGKIL